MIAVIAYTDVYDNDLRQVVVRVDPEDSWKDSLKKAVDLGLYGPDEYADEYKTLIDSLPMDFDEALKQMWDWEYQVAYTLIHGDTVVL